MTSLPTGPWCCFQLTDQIGKFQGGREFWKVQQVNADTDHAWTAPWSKTLQGVTPDMRVIFESKVYEILAVIDVNMDHEEIQILTRR
jgi:SPP1 family predicted phage head-tail adaptor